MADGTGWRGPAPTRGVDGAAALAGGAADRARLRWRDAPVRAGRGRALRPGALLGQGLEALALLACWAVFAVLNWSIVDWALGALGL